jgi:hypothetical protein
MSPLRTLICHPKQIIHKKGVYLYLTAEHEADPQKSAIAKFYDADDGKQNQNKYYASLKRTLRKKILIILMVHGD